MARRRQRQSDPSVLFVVIIIGAGLWFAFKQSQFEIALILSLFLLVLAIIGFILFTLNKQLKEKLSRSGIEQIDTMSGIEFEQYLQSLLERRGYTSVQLTTTYDLGVDLIAKKDNDIWAIQAKRYKGTVGLDAVRQVVAAKNHYGCTKAMVITNSYFTRNAQAIAKSTDCVLVDRPKLIDLILSIPHSG